MAPNATRFIMVDDTDSGIQYTGPWFSLNPGAEDNLGDAGAPFLSTLHGVNSSGSLSYTFNGSQVQIYGSGRPETQANDTSWYCGIDGVPVGRWTQSTTYPGNNILLCNTNLFDGEHTITLYVGASDTSILFDRINYAPSANVPLDNTYIQVDASDPAISYSSGWQPLMDIATATQQPSAGLNFTFIGTSLSWYSRIVTNFSINPSFGTYKIDGQLETKLIFPLDGLPHASEGNVYNQLFFTTPQLSPGQHTIEVDNGIGSSSNTTPLSLEYLIVHNGAMNSKARIAGGQIAGGVVGGIVGVIIILSIILLLLRKRRNANTRLNPEPSSERPTSDGRSNIADNLSD
ncbi:hypothetical protein GALMADRAFT_258429 [Galerina marginata CBS 339.88]|uniref:Uncharacterized protein n=1 Tax=Galerina marginata (strain CBS 339.88) TaxID=685588 RepID=A0A067SKF4_GALM3|nr:hypothetical protein GALMADRAFT_258429 [Galerina marginata CBS 339.88]